MTRRPARTFPSRNPFSLRWNWFRESSPGAGPLMGSEYVLMPGAAKIMAGGRVPGVVVTPELLKQVQVEWQDKKKGHPAAFERSARLAVILKGLGYKGAHFGGINHNFDTLAQILDRMEQIEHRWRFCAGVRFSAEKRVPPVFSGSGNRIFRYGIESFNKHHIIRGKNAFWGISGGSPHLFQP